MPPSGSAPAKWFTWMRNSVTTLSPLSGSIPMKLFLPISKEVTDSIARMPPWGSAPANWLV
eukprot:176974-Amphidinium_carterae.1